MKQSAIDMRTISYVDLPIMTTYEVDLVLLAVIAVIASYTALVAGQITLTQGRVPSLWLIGSVIAMGIGIWAMHFIAMLVYDLTIPVNYDSSIVLVSIAIAIIASGAVLFVVSRQKLGWLQLLAGSVFVGLSITAMHYTAMTAMRLEVIDQYDPLVTLSVVIAISATLTAIWLAFHLGAETTAAGLRNGSAIFMGNTIAGMDYTAMAAVSFKPTNQLVVQPLHSINPASLAVAIGITALLILGLTLLTSWNQRLSETKSSESLRQSHELEIKVEERTTELSQANKQLQSEISEYQRAEEEVRFLQAMTQAISESADFDSALGVVLRKMCDFTGWKYGEAWIPSSDGTTIECSPAWDGTNQNLEKFRQLSAGYTFPPGTGLPGRVWSSRHPEWIKNVSSADTVFLQKQFVTEAGFKAALGIPITDDKQVLAVLVFFMFESCEEDKRLVEIVSTVGTQLGSLLQGKRAESALRKSEERFRLLVESVKDYAIFMLDTDGQIASWNSGAEHIFGYHEAEIIGQPFSTIFTPEDIRKGNPEQEQQIAEAVEKGVCERWHMRKDGTSFWASDVLTALRDEGGKLHGFSKVTRDITERKQVEDALRQSEEQLQAILDNSTALISVKDLQGRYILINRWYRFLFHLNAKEVVGKTDYDIFPKEMADIYRANDQKVLAAKMPLVLEEVVPQDNELHKYISSKFPLYDAARVPYAICGISTDITKLKQAEDALRSSMATNQALLNAIPDLMFRLSKDGTFVNFKAAKDNNLLILPSDLGKKVDEVLPKEVAQQTMDCMEQALETGEIQIFESHLLLNNKIHDYETRIVVSAEDEVMAIVRDITERKQAEKDIRSALDKEKELNDLKSRFVSMTSHEFRTPLTTILSSAALVERYSHKLSEEKKFQHFQRIQAAVKHMTQMLDDVLLIGKAEAGKLEFNPTRLELAQFCHELVEEIQISTDNHAIAISTQNECTNACMDEKLLRHIFANLLSNAIKYSPQGSTVYFDLICKQEEAIFQVQDQGIGIPIADQAQLFDSFHRASNVGTISGTGLGLAIVKKAVDLHGGKITVKSVVKAGTTFTVTIPLEQLDKNR